MQKRFDNFRIEKITNLLVIESINDVLHYGNIEHGFISKSIYGLTVEFRNERAIDFKFDLLPNGGILETKANTYIKYDDIFYIEEENIKISTFEDIKNILNRVRDMPVVDCMDYLKVCMKNMSIFNSKYPKFKNFIENYAATIEDNPNGTIVKFENKKGIFISDKKVFPFVDSDNKMVPIWGTYGELTEINDNKLLKLAKILEAGDIDKLEVNSFLLATNPSIDEFIKKYNVYNFLSEMGPEGLKLVYPIGRIDIENIIGHTTKHIEIVKNICFERKILGKEEANLSIHIKKDKKYYCVDSIIDCINESKGISIKTVSNDNKLSCFDVLRIVESKFAELKGNAEIYISKEIY